MGLLLATASVGLYLGGNPSGLSVPTTTAADGAEYASTSNGAVVEAAFSNLEQGIESEHSEAEVAAERTEVVVDIEESTLFTIQVWDRKRGVVAAEAEVFVLEGYRGSELSDPFGPHQCELAIAKGKRYRASSEGRVALPRLQDRAIVAATLPGASGAPGASGVLTVRKGHAELVSVLVRDDETVTVRVVDQVGRPLANVPVGIQQRIPQRRRNFTPDKDKLRLLLGEQNIPTQGKEGQKKDTRIVTEKLRMKARRRTGAAGLAVFKHFQLYRERSASWWPKSYINSFEAVLMVPLAKPVRAAFGGQPVPESVIELRMPQTGSVALRTVDRDGRPFTQPVRAELRVAGMKSSPWARTSMRKLQNEREIVFPYVGVGADLDAFCRLDDNDFRWEMSAFPGPVEAGEQVAVDLIVAPGAAMLYGRLLDQDGAALAGAKTTLLINSVRGRLEGEEVTMDDQGRFHLPYNLSERHQSPWRLQVRYQGRTPVPGLAMTLATLPKEGVVDLGDLQIEEVAQITYGRVVNDLGEALVGARVQLQRERESGRGRRLSWQDEAFTVATTDEAGDFSLFGDVEAGNYRLRVTADEHFACQEPGLPSRDGVVIEMLRRSRVVGSVLTPEWLASRRVRVHLECHSSPGNNKDAKVFDYQGRKMIYFDWVRPGIYSLSLRIEEFPDAFVTIDNFELKAGQRDEHPRLKGLEIGGGLFRYEVFAVDEAGKSIAPKTPMRGRLMRPDGRDTFVGFNWQKDRAEIISSQSSIEVLPEEPGFRAASQTLIAGRNTVRFHRVSPVTVHTPGMRELVHTESVWISLEPIDVGLVEAFDSRSRRLARTVANASSSYGRLNNRDRATLQPIRDGRYRVVARLGGKRRSGLTKLTLGEVVVRVTPGGEPVECNVAVDAAAVIAALEVVAQKRAAPPSPWSAWRR